MFKTIIKKECDLLSINDYLSSIRLGQNKINHFLASGDITINNNVVKDKDYLLKKNDKIIINTSYYDDIIVEPVYYNLDILYEDDYILAVRKPRGLIIYSDNEVELTLDKYVASYYAMNNIDACVRHIHRLDKETTGVIVYAKDVITHGALSSIFEERKISKKYLTVVKGKISKDGLVDFPIGKDRHHSSKMICSKSGLKALTKYHIIQANNNYTYLECLIETGRTHQIRLHLSSIHHPVIGDVLYNEDRLDIPLLLECYQMEFIHPITHEKLLIECPIDEHIKKFVIKNIKNIF